MALSLAACGSDSAEDTTDSSTDDTTDTTVVAPVSLVLTTSVDDVTGGAGNDSISAIQTGGDDETFSAYDAIDGGDGIDVLTITNTEAAVLNLANVTDVEQIVYRSVGGGGTIDLDNFAGAEKLTLDRSAGALDVNNLGIDDALVISDATATQDSTITYKASAVTGTADAGSVTVDGVTDGAEVTFAGAIESFTVTASGDDSRLDVFELPGTVTALTIDASVAFRVDDTFTGAALESVTITGAGNVTITPALAATVETVTASAATGNITMTMGAADQTITTGAGDDVIDMQGNLTKNDTIDLGAGSNTLRVDADSQAAGAFDLSISNVQTFRFDNMAGNDGAINMDNLAPTAVRLDAAQGATQAATAGVLTLTDMTSAVSAFSMIGSGALGAPSDNLAFNGLTIDYDVSGTTNVSQVDIIVNNGGVVADDIFVGALDMNNVEALVITGTNIGQAAADELTIANINGNDLASITIVADGEVIISDIDSGGDNVLESLDLSGVTAGGVTVSDISGNAAAFTITGSAFADSITNGVNTAANEVTVDLGAGNDSYVSLDAMDTITTGTGSDTITFQGDANDDDNVITDFTAGAGGDIIAFDTVAAAGFGDLVAYVETAGSATLDDGMTVYTGDNLTEISEAAAAVAFATAGLVDADTDGDIGYIVASDGTDTGIFLFTDAAGTNAIAAGELTLLVTLEGVGVAANLSAANFADFL